MTDDDTTDCTEELSHDGRSVHIDTGFFEVQVWGDPDDSLKDVTETAFEAADRARRDVEEMDDQLDGDGSDAGHYQ